MYSNATRTVSNDRSDAYIRSTKKKDGGGVSWTGTGHPLKLAAAVQVIGWWAQLHPGHAIFEGAKPALLDGFGQALSVAPLFAFYEGLWACGIHTGLQARTLQLVAANTKALCAAGATLPAREFGPRVHSREAVEAHLREARHRSAVLRALLGIGKDRRDAVAPIALVVAHALQHLDHARANDRARNGDHHADVLGARKLALGNLGTRRQVAQARIHVGLVEQQVRVVALANDLALHAQQRRVEMRKEMRRMRKEKRAELHTRLQEVKRTAARVLAGSASRAHVSR